MTPRERVHQLVDQLPESEMDVLVLFLEELAGAAQPDGPLRRVPLPQAEMPDLTNLTIDEYLDLVERA